MSESSLTLPKTAFKRLNPFGGSLGIVPGVLVTAFLAWVSIELADIIGTELLGFENSPVSAVMVALVIGMVLGNVVPLPQILAPGIRFSVKTVLRVGIILLGIRLSLFDVFKLGLIGLPIVLLCILSALVVTERLGKWLNLPRKLAALIAVGTSICGVSAVLATGPAIDADAKDVAYAVAVITVFGMIATVLYPFAADTLFGANATQAGLFLGTAIHDTSQVTGAGLVYSEVFDRSRGLDVATVTKMVRNVLMAFVIPVMALRYNRQGDEEYQRIPIKRLLPLFVLGFIAMAIFRSMGDAGINAGQRAFWLWDAAQWESLHALLHTWAVNLLVIALAGVGLSLKLDVIRALGFKPFAAGLGAALVVGMVSIVLIALLGSFVTF